MTLALALYPLQAWGENIGVHYSSPIAIIFIIVFSVLMIGIGIYAGRRQSNEEDYFAAGRSGGIIVVSLAIFASIQSGWGMVGVTGTGYEIGVEYLLITGTLVPLGFVISYWLLGRKMRILGETHDAITVPDAMFYQFNDERVRLLGSISVLLGCIGYLAAQYAALGIIGSLILPVNFLEALLLGLIVVGFYTVIGGMLAAIWSDAVQGIVMIIGALLTAFFLITNYPGGTSGMISDIMAHNPGYFNFSLLGMNGTAAIGLLLSVVIINLTVAGQPHAITKFYMIRDVSLLRWGPLLTAVGYAVTALYWVAAPFARAAVTAGHVPNPGTPDAALPLAVIEYSPDVVVAFVLTAVIAAIMSTSNSFLNMGASAVVHDYFIKYSDKELSDKEEVRYARLTTFGILVVAFILVCLVSQVSYLYRSCWLGDFRSGHFSLRCDCIQLERGYHGRRTCRWQCRPYPRYSLGICC